MFPVTEGQVTEWRPNNDMFYYYCCKYKGDPKTKHVRISNGVPISNGRPFLDSMAAILSTTIQKPD